MFLAVSTETQEITFVNIQDVTEIRHNEGEWIAITRDGTILHVDLADVIRATATVVSAEKDEIAFRLYALGSLHAEEVLDENHIAYLDYRVLAWAISPFMQPVPITVVGYLVPKPNEVVLIKVSLEQFYSYDGNAFNTIPEACRALAEKINLRREQMSRTAREHREEIEANRASGPAPWQTAAAPSAPTNPEAAE